MSHAPPQRPVRRGRPDPPEILELRRLRSARPELADAVDLEIALFGLQRRTQQRLPVPWLEVNEDWLHRQLAEGRPLLRFEDVPVTAGDLRLIVREVAELLHRTGLLDRESLERTQRLVREDHDLLAIAARWFNATAAPERAGGPDGFSLDESVLQLAMRPFLARCAESLTPRLNGGPGTATGRCPLCAGEPELGMRTAAGTLVLACSRCTCRWRCDDTACLFCGCRDPEARPSFSSGEPGYTLSACNGCRRYLKIVDTRVLGRPLLLPADAIATLPLDAAALQRGYRS